MTQADRDRLVTLRKARKKLVTQREAAAELGVSVRQVQRLLRALEERGDKAVVHGLRGARSNRRIEEKIQQKAIRILAREEYEGFGPPLASEYLASHHGIAASRETVRQWMTGAGLWKPGKQKLERVHQWRPRRSRFGELVQWDTSDHDWLEGRGEALYLIGMIDDATSRAKGRFVRRDSTEANMGMLEGWLRCYGRMLACYTDKAGLFQTAHKTKRDESRAGKDREPMPPTQIGRALGELNISRASRSGGDPQPCGNPPSEKRLHDSVRGETVWDPAGGHLYGLAWLHGASRKTPGWPPGHPFPGPIPPPRTV